ncbi:MAG: HTTM domain-containing protein, partial [Gemmataceae bacterium]
NNRMAELLNGGDSLFRNGLWFLLLSPAGAAWSVDAWLRGGKGGPVLIEPWSVRLMQIQLALMYLFTGLTKLADVRPDPSSGWWWPRGDWLDGVALYWVLNDVALARWSYAQAPVPLAVCKLMTWGTLFFELTFWLLILIRPIRPLVVLAGLGLHLGILVTMEIGWFSQVSMCFYALFLPGDWLARRVARSTPDAPGA